MQPSPILAFVAAEEPRVQASGHSEYLLGFLRHFSQQGFRVVLLVTSARLGFIVSRPTMSPARYEVRSPAAVRTLGRLTVARPGAALRHLAWSGFRRAPIRLQRLADAVRTRWRRSKSVDHVLGTDLDEQQVAWLTSALEDLGPEAVFFNTLFSVPSPLRLPQSVRASYIVTTDVVFERAAAFNAQGYNVVPRNFTPKMEAERLRPSPNVVAIQWDDAERLSALVPEANVLVSPASIAAPASLSRTPVGGRCLFVGSGSLHNVDGIQWFIRECWPRVVARRPDAELHIVGTVCARLSSSTPGVVRRGEVEDLSGEYALASAVIIPLRVGSGLKIKLVEALCHGTAVVTTSVGAQGLLAMDPRPFELADSSDEFTRALLAVLSDPDRQRDLEEAAGAIAPRFSPDQAYAALDEDLRRQGVLPPTTT